jgi:hypothetical protein
MFGWMFAILKHDKSKYKEESEDNETIFKDIENPAIMKSLIY